ncbi:MAG TPA: dihydrofolate reductase family protein [Saprospiraceae bacterium]|nr:dihydrofolate reductase family protein [Saprospiraceae bacterium]
MHTSLDGFAATLKGELDWVKLDDAMFDFVGEITQQADTALYGRVTYEMMESYWPTAGSQPNASKHDIEHSEWYNKVPKIVLSRTLKEKDLENVTVISDDLKENINKIKNKEGKNIVIFGSPSAANSLLNEGLVDEFWLFVNPILLGEGIPLFEGVPATVNLKLSENKLFDAGVMALHYQTNNH